MIAHDAAQLVRDLGLEPGSMTLVEADRVDELYTKLGPTIEISGGSAANTIAGIASFGGAGAFIGRVADDDFGRIYAHDLRSIGVHFDAPTAPAGGTPTGRCLVIVTPDAQRTMSTFLGAGSALDPGLRRPRTDRERAGALPRGLPLGPAAGDGGLPRRVGRRARRPAARSR